MKKRGVVGAFLALVWMVFCLSGCGGSKKLTSFEILGQKLACHMDMEKVLAAFADEKYEYFESISCAYNGLDKIYEYKNAGFTVYTYPKDDRDYVLEITVTSDKIRQLSGKLYNGMPMEETEKLFGTDYKLDGETRCYAVGDDLSINLLPEDGKLCEYTLSAAK